MTQDFFENLIFEVVELFNRVLQVDICTLDSGVTINGWNVLIGCCIAGLGLDIIHAMLNPEFNEL